MGIHPSIRISLSVLGFIFAYFLCLLVLAVPKQASPQTQASRQSNDPSPNRQQPTEQKRRIIQTHNQPPEIKYKIRNLQNNDWPKDLEVEFKNMSDKPIYYIRIYLIMREVQFDGASAAFMLEYGKSRLDLKTEFAEEGDIPIKPGESHIFKIPENQLENVAKKVADRGVKFNVTKVEFNLYTINFGDGTGYFAGQPDFRPIKK